MDKKRIFIILGFTVFCILLGYAIYRVFFAPRTTPGTTGPSSTTTTTGSFPTIGDGTIPTGTSTGTTLPVDTGSGSTDTGTNTGGIIPGRTGTTPLSSPTVEQPVTVSVAGAAAGAGTNARFYNQTDGKFYTLDSKGQVRALSETVFYNVSNVVWSPETNTSIIEYPDGSNIYYNFDINTQVTLPKHWESFSFSDDGTQISAKSLGLSPENRWLITSDPRGNTINLIEPLGDNASKVIVDWSPNKQIVALSATGDALGSNQQEILLVGQNKENFKSITVEGRGLETKWSPEGTKLLHSVYNGRNNYKPELWIVDATPDTAGNNRKPLGVNTWASKCTMANERTVYCGVPETLETGAGFAPEIANFTPDILYKIDTITGIRTEIDTETPHVIDSMFIGADGSTLYFTDKNQNGIFQIEVN